MNIAIDGPAGAGKSTIAKLVAKEIGNIYVDTGAMYRAIALHVLRSGIDPDDTKLLEAAADKADVTIRHIGDERVAREHHGRDARGVLERGSGNLRRVDNAGFNEVFVDVGERVVAEVSFTLANFFRNDAAVFTGVVGDLRNRGAAGA